MKLENIRDLSQNQNNYIGINRKIISKNFNGRKLGYPLKPDKDYLLYNIIIRYHEQNRRDSIAECELNGESFPNGNAVPINSRKVIECVETVHSLS